MSKQRSRLFGAGVAASGGLLLVSACATTRATSVTKDGGQESYRIECGELGDCWTEAGRACRGPYRAVEQHEYTLTESNLAGVNSEAQANALPPYYPDGHVLPSSVPQYGPAVRSDEPIPLAEVVVVCTGG